MYTIPRYNYLRRSVYGSHYGSWRPVKDKPVSHAARVQQALKSVFISRLALNTMEGRYLERIIHPEEHIGGAVYGRHETGFAMMVATDRRVIFLDCKPMFTNEDEINYYVVSGVSFGRSGFAATVTLHTRIKDYKFKTFNAKSAAKFVEFIEARCLEHDDPEEEKNAQFN